MNTREQWAEEKFKKYGVRTEELVLDLLLNNNDIIEQLMNNPNDSISSDILLEAMECNNLLFSKIEKYEKRVGEIFDILKNRPELLKDENILNSIYDFIFTLDPANSVRMRIMHRLSILKYKIEN